MAQSSRWAWPTHRSHSGQAACSSRSPLVIVRSFITSSNTTAAASRASGDIRRHRGRGARGHRAVRLSGGPHLLEPGADLFG